MPRFNIIILDQVDKAPPRYRYLFWADVPTSRRVFYENPNAASAWKDATPADLLALQDGIMVEKVDVLQVAPNTPIPQIQAFLEAKWTAYQAAVAAENPWARYGTTWDGTAWVVGGVA